MLCFLSCRLVSCLPHHTRALRLKATTTWFCLILWSIWHWGIFGMGGKQFLIPLFVGASACAGQSFTFIVLGSSQQASRIISKRCCVKRYVEIGRRKREREREREKEKEKEIEKKWKNRKRETKNRTLLPSVTPLY